MYCELSCNVHIHFYLLTTILLYTKTYTVKSVKNWALNNPKTYVKDTFLWQIQTLWKGGVPAGVPQKKQVLGHYLPSFDNKQNTSLNRPILKYKWGSIYTGFSVDIISKCNACLNDFQLQKIQITFVKWLSNND